MPSRIRCLLLCLALTPALFAAPRAFVLAIGLDRLDSAYYDWDGRLASCVQDASFYLTLAPDGPQVSKQKLVNEAATYAAVRGALRDLARQAVAGDLVIIGYSGHGLQIPDTNHDERLNHPYDVADEAWCLYDRILIDDELYQHWGEFAPGVDIVVVADCCHAGTITKELQDSVLSTWSRFRIAERRRREEVRDLQLVARRGLKGGVDTLDTVLREKSQVIEPAAPATNDLADLLRKAGDVDSLRIKQMPPLQALLFVEKESATLAAQQADIPAEGPEMKASVFLFAACGDEQTAIALAGQNSLFTATLKSVWQTGFHGSYADLAAAVMKKIPATLRTSHTPATYRFGADADRLARAPAFRPGS